MSKKKTFYDQYYRKQRSKLNGNQLRSLIYERLNREKIVFETCLSILSDDIAESILNYGGKTNAL